MVHTTPLARAARSPSDRDTPASAPVRYRRTPAGLQFPGCRPIALRRDRLADFDGRLEYWEARTETAWVLAEPTGGIHESTSRRLAELARLIAAVRGAPIRAFGSVDLRVNDDAGRADRIMQADETHVVPESVAFPGWTAPEIHVALTEPLTTKRTCEVLERVGRTLGAREGTGPQDDPLLRVLGSRERAEGKAEGRAKGQADLVRALLAERGITVSESFTARAAKDIDSPGGTRIAAAALACTDEADFWRRLDQP